MRLDLAGSNALFIRRQQSDFDTVRQVWRDEDYKIDTPVIEARVRDRYDRILASGGTPVIVDAGANIGAASVWFASLYPRACVVAVEPNPDSVDILRRNAEGRNIVVVPSAIGAEAGFVRLIEDGLAWATKTERAEDGLAIVTVADCVACVPDGVLFIVKVDIEGFEDDLFASSVDWVDEAQVVFIEPHDWMLPDQHTSRNFQAVMGARPFRILMRGENLIYVRAD